MALQVDVEYPHGISFINVAKMIGSRKVFRAERFPHLAFYCPYTLTPRDAHRCFSSVLCWDGSSTTEPSGDADVSLDRFDCHVIDPSISSGRQAWPSVPDVSHSGNTCTVAFCARTFHVSRCSNHTGPSRRSWMQSSIQESEMFAASRPPEVGRPHRSGVSLHFSSTLLRWIASRTNSLARLSELTTLLHKTLSVVMGGHEVILRVQHARGHRFAQIFRHTHTIIGATDCLTWLREDVSADCTVVMVVVLMTIMHAINCWNVSHPLFCSDIPHENCKDQT